MIITDIYICYTHICMYIYSGNEDLVQKLSSSPNFSLKILFDCCTSFSYPNISNIVSKGMYTLRFVS